MKTLYHSLRAIAHPLSIASILFLILNDHVLKPLYASWWMGKLSDFTGLFFFPFVLSAFLSVPLEFFLRPRNIIRLSFIITAVWFVGIKTLPWVNDFTENGIGIIIGHPTFIALDPSDIIALSVLWPAWKLSETLSKSAHSPIPRKFSWVFLILASWATMATTPCGSPPKVMNVAADRQGIYAYLTYDDSRNWFFRSEDGGATWDEIKDPSSEIEKLLLEPVTYPQTVCAPNNSLLCYRTEVLENLEISKDGGETWDVIWEIPAGRRRFMERYLVANNSGCGKKPEDLDFGPYALAFWQRPDGGTSLIAAMGNEGVLISSGETDFDRYAVSSATPTPYETSLQKSPNIFYTILPEIELSFLVSFFIWLFLNIWLWWQLVVVKKAIHTQTKLFRWFLQSTFGLGLWLLGTVIGTLWLIKIIGLLPGESSSFDAILFWVGNMLLSMAIIYAFPIIFLIVGAFIFAMNSLWDRVLQVLPDPTLIKRATRIITGHTILLFFLLWLPAILWGAGIVPSYTYSLGSMLIIIVGMTIKSIYSLLTLINGERRN